MFGGENVGRAYVKLYADGDEVPDNIQDAMDRLDPIMRDAGEKHSEAYWKGHEKQTEKSSTKARDKVLKSLQKGLGRFHAIGDQLGTDFFDGLQLAISRELDDNDIGARIRDRLEDDFARNGSFDRIAQQLRNINQLAIDASLAIERDLADSIHDTVRETDKAAKSTIDWRKGVDDVWASVHELDEEIESGNRSVRKWFLEWKEGQSHVLHVREALASVNAELDKSAERTGRIFGKGSRNDFLNFVGSLVEGTQRLLQSPLNLAEKLFGGGSGGGGGFVKLAGSAASSIVGIAIAVTALVTVLGPVAALVSGVSAALIALAGSAAFAAGAVGGVALALTGPLVAGIGIGIAALMNLDKETKDALSSVKDEFGDLADVAGKAIGPGLRQAVRIIKPEIAGLNDLFEGTGEALGDVAVRFAKITQSSAYRKFIDEISKFIPDAIESLGNSAANFTEGMMGVFRSTTPLAEDFLDWLEDITQQFADWANSEEGQQQLIDFFEAAADSAESVGDFLGAAAEALGELLSQGRDEGDDIFQSMADSLERFTKYLRDNPDAVESFFENGVDVAEALGNLLLDIGDFIDKLDNPDTREQLMTIFEIVRWLVTETGEWADKMMLTWEMSKEVAGAVAAIGTAAAEAAGDTGKLIQDIVTAPKDATDALVDFVAGIPGWFRGLGPRITNAIDSVNWDRIIVNPVNRVHGWFRGLGGRITNAIGNVNWSDIIPNPISRVIGWFEGVAGRIVRAMGDVDWKDVIHNPVDDIVGWFSGLAGRIENAIGSIDIDINWPDPPGWLSSLGGGLSSLVKRASGAIEMGPAVRLVGEAGPEAIVPLDRPLSMVDPSVRGLSAIAQGKASVGGGTTVEAGAVVITGVLDPEAAAIMAVNEIIAKGA